MRERRETLSFLSPLPRRERPLLAGNKPRDSICTIKVQQFVKPGQNAELFMGRNQPLM